MRVGGVLVSPGRRTIAMPWLWVERMPRCRTVIWGGHADKDIWICSDEDRQRERARRERVRRQREREAMLRMVLLLRDDLTPTLRTMSEAMADVAAAWSKLADAQRARA